MKIALRNGPDAPVAFGLDQLLAAGAELGAELSVADGVDGDRSPAVIAGLVGADDAASRRAVEIAPGRPAEDSFRIRNITNDRRKTVALVGSDTRGLMYGFLHLAEQVRMHANSEDLFAGVHDIESSPFLAERAMSVYTMHPRVWEKQLADEQYWTRLFATMAKSRLNRFVVVFGYENAGYLAPVYPFFFDVTGHPGVRMVGCDRTAQEAHTAQFRRMIRLAHDHGVHVTAAIWDHIYRGRVQTGGIPYAPEPGQEFPDNVVGVTTENVTTYTRAGLIRLLDVFDELDGIQLRMHEESGLRRDEMESFWHELFATIKKARPELQIDLRAKELPNSIVGDAVEQGLAPRITTKFWMEQLGMPFHPLHVNPQDQSGRRHGFADLLKKPRPFDIVFRLWNAPTSGGLTWANRSWVRRFVQSVGDDGVGFEFNAPNATWMLGRPRDEEPLPVHTAPCRWYDYEIERHWYTLMLFGRLGYDRDTPDAVFDAVFKQRFGTAAEPLVEAIHRAGEVIPRVVGAACRYDFYPTTRRSVARDGQGPLSEFSLAEGSDLSLFCGFREEAERIVGLRSTAKIRPQVSAAFLESAARDILDLPARARAAGELSAEAVLYLTDAAILAHLARFYARRIPAAVAFNLYQLTGDLHALDDAVENERAAISSWRDLVAAAGDVYSEELPIGIRRPALHGHWKDELIRLQGYLADLESWANDQEKLDDPYRVFLGHVPQRTVRRGENLELRATVHWPHDIKRVVAYVTSHDGISTTIPLEHRGGKRFGASVPGASLADSFEYSISAECRRGDRISTPAGVDRRFLVTVCDDRAAPIVEHRPVAKATEGEKITVAARVTGRSGPMEAHLRFRHQNQQLDYRRLPMVAQGDSYVATIPGEYVTKEWDIQYYIEVVDRCGEGTIYPDFDTGAPYLTIRVRR